MTGESDMNQFTVVDTINARRRRLRIRRLKYTCQSEVPISISDENGGEEGHGGLVKGELSFRKTTREEKTNDCSSQTEICLSLTSASADNSSCKNELVLSGFGEEESREKSGLGCISYGSVSLIGRRREMEDAVRVELGFLQDAGERYDFFGVYDGHGGARVAEACSERLHKVLLHEITIEGNNDNDINIKAIEWEKVMNECFGKMDKEVMMDRMMGSTAVVAVVGNEEIVVANCGDSRAVLSRAGVAIPLSVDHKPDRPDELERVESAGGRVINWEGHRVLGVLATSRSIGDEYLKPFVISKPEVTVSERTEKDEFLILASDGLWDVISNEAACLIVRRCLRGRLRRKSHERIVNRSRVADAVSKLAELAMARGSGDNISVIVVDLKNGSNFS
ncbi:hypothetical protein K2173_008678 [Erythroxylum novogranatense]|uniref:protein-serine/threonine phosphatase n=1 Tax=Erythroxylum novogranatense TaxID=1862640 RepID=A0AAV8SLW6_9ROSI|nr:hypothetical protein K2173_008678 [Erythroxylum novogranatense]